MTYELDTPANAMGNRPCTTAESFHSWHNQLWFCNGTAETHAQSGVGLGVRAMKYNPPTLLTKGAD